MKKFSSQASPELLQALKNIAKIEGRHFQSLLNEALQDFIEKKNTQQPRKHVQQYFVESLQEYDSLYEDLAK